MEVLEIDNEIQELILKGGSEEDIYAVARKNGFVSMKEDAIIKALDHVIPYEEVNSFGTKVGMDNLIEPEEQDEVQNGTVDNSVQTHESDV